jgi:hypothetical protein
MTDSPPSVSAPVLRKLQAFTALNRAAAGDSLPPEIRCFAIAAARFYPAVKRALGYARSCGLVPVQAA